MNKLPKSRRVRKRRDFHRLQRHGTKGNAQHLMVTGKQVRKGNGRLGLTISGKVGNAVTRNRLKRWAREIFRTSQDSWDDLDLVLIARPGAGDLEWDAFKTEVFKALKNLRRNLKKSKHPGRPFRHNGRRKDHD